MYEFSAQLDSKIRKYGVIIISPFHKKKNMYMYLLSFRLGVLTLLHSEQPKLHWVLAILSAIGLT